MRPLIQIPSFYIRFSYVPGFLAPDRLHPGRYVIPLRLSGIRKRSGAPENRNLIEMQFLASAKNLSMLVSCHAAFYCFVSFLFKSDTRFGGGDGDTVGYR